MSQATRRTRATPSNRLTYVILGSAWSSIVLVSTGWALIGTVPILVLTATVIIGGSRWRLVLPFAAAFTLSQTVAIGLWATRETPPPSLTKDYDPLHVALTVALGATTAFAAHYAVRCNRKRIAANIAS
ncbi:hypothetical protein ITJ64_05530 [Herbiconiux sp. VKM Ac-1786]|uniref:hypothetical protein n=1 Tax=Herbiconiux sp. VKM Ac-1786 TaxID=2783824 RepID=UPI00188DAB8F|nr:hypothetical protein [Herbiconiux sp. VKM Ac-1786]MBF4571973.1 hypothetical protein [Herbiconiux sp. VKM Ac-1786]